MMDEQDKENDISSQSQPLTPWKSSHYERVREGQEVKLRCLAIGCDKTYKDRGSHTTLRSHWEKKHGEQTVVARTTFTFHNENHIDKLAKFFIDAHMEYSLADRTSFHKYNRAMDPTKKIICSKTLSRTINNRSKDLKQDVKSALIDADSIALTFDIWSPRKGASGYGCITGHFIDSKWDLKSVILEFKLMPHPHDAISICNFIAQVILEFDIKQKVIAITTDNGSNVVAAINQLIPRLQLDTNFGTMGFTHYRCMGHIIHLAVRDALKGLKPLLINLRKFVSIMRSSGKRSETFKKYQETLIELNDPEFDIQMPLELIDDVESRWNSCFLMINRIGKLKRAVQNCISSLAELKDIDIDWTTTEALIRFMKPLYDFTKQFSGQNYCTISLICSSVPKIHEFLDQNFGNDLINISACDLKSKLSSFVENIHQDITLIAAIIDPRFKLHGIPTATQNVGLSKIRIIAETELDTSVLSSHSQVITGEDDFFADLYASEEIDELSAYLSAPREGKKTDVIAYWKGKVSQFPKLANLAKRILPIQATSTASERVFSLANVTLTDKRHRLHPESFQANILCHSWLEFLKYD